MTGSSQPVPRPPFWVRLSVTGGNLLQLAGLIAGAMLLRVAARSDAADIIPIVIMVIGWLVMYCCSHALGHWLVGRLVGIRFRGYGLRGTDHPENYPPGFRQVMNVTPFFTVMTEKASMAKASPVAKALMFAAGETATSICAIAAGWYAWSRQIPGGGVLFVLAIVASVYATISTAQLPKGDYAKALRALRGS